MREVIRIDQKEVDDKPVEFTHVIINGWLPVDDVLPNEYDKVVYLGHCDYDGDLFSCYYSGGIDIFKGHLNSGKY